MINTKLPFVENNEKFSEDIFKITINCPEIAKKSKPGQFISILCEDLVLRRPFSIAGATENTISVLYKLKGKGTKFISKLKKDEEIDLIGPLGNGFNIQNKKSILVGGGVGVAPLLFISENLKTQNIPFNFVAGFQSLPESYKTLPENSYIITEDGSSDYKGRIDKYLEQIIKENKPEIIYSCGPKPVLQYVSKIAEQFNIEAQVALERDFACGIGVCMGCSIEIKENDKIVNKRICKDGPVFEGRTVIW